MEFGYTCTNGAVSKFPYGDTYQTDRCLDADWVDKKGEASLEVTTLSNRTCHGTKPPFDQVYDLSGSVSEWQNLCKLVGSLGCARAGGNWKDEPEYQACAGHVGFGSPRDLTPAIGFRCCADAPPP
jgi:formylglycine-generating enzyme required for sulfatase activity